MDNPLDESRPALLTVNERLFIALHTQSYPGFLVEILTIPLVDQIAKLVDSLLRRTNRTQVAQSLVHQCAEGSIVGSPDRA